MSTPPYGNSDPSQQQYDPYTAQQPQWQQPQNHQVAQYLEPTYVPPTTIEHPRATAVFVTGLLSVVAGIPPLGIVAVILGNGMRAEIAHEPHRYRAGMGNAGWVLGIIGCVLTVFIVLFFIAWVMFFVAAVSS